MNRFPTFSIALLAIGIVWLLNDLQIISVNIPWIPVVIIVISLGMMLNRYNIDCRRI